jgi:hypothetical protein
MATGTEFTCIKCGSIDNTVQYDDGRRMSSVSQTSCLHVTCSRCGYQWDEAPADETTKHITIEGREQKG